jgi:hypothetical protein
MGRKANARCLPRLAAALLMATAAHAGPFVAPGELSLRHDVQMLADAGVIEAPVSSWPLSWGDILNDIGAYSDDGSLTEWERAALMRVRRLGGRRTALRSVRWGTRVAYDAEPTQLRGFQQRARESTEGAVAADWMGERFAGRIEVTGVDSDNDKQDVRLDGSYAAIALGNVMVAAGAMDRWWGPGYDGSLILSNNARPIPAISIERNDTGAFKTPWLSWIGPWDASFVYGQLEDDRAVPNTRFLGLRVNFRPLPSLEIGLSRTAQWCGSGRPCDLDTLVKLAIGRGNRGDAGVQEENEPGNQLAGVDLRWSPRFLPLNAAIYGQFIGEDEAGGFPSQYLGQIGGEISGAWRLVSYRAFVEYAGTSCRFYQSTANANCAYNNAIYPSGYRYRGRAIGHTADNDADLYSAGIIAVEPDGDTWDATLRFGELNNEGPPDNGNSLTPTPADYAQVEVSYTTAMKAGTLRLGAGLSRFEDKLTGSTDDDSRLFVEWRVAF